MSVSPFSYEPKPLALTTPATFAEGITFAEWLHQLTDQINQNTSDLQELKERIENMATTQGKTIASITGDGVKAIVTYTDSSTDSFPLPTAKDGKGIVSITSVGSIATAHYSDGSTENFALPTVNNDVIIVGESPANVPAPSNPSAGHSDAYYLTYAGTVCGLPAVAGIVVTLYTGTEWLLYQHTSSNNSPLPTVDSVAPVAGEISVQNVSNSGFTALVTGASDDTTSAEKLQYKFQLSSDNGVTWQGDVWEKTNSHAYTGLSASTTYKVRCTVKDEAGNTKTGSELAVSTTSLKTWSIASYMSNETIVAQPVGTPITNIPLSAGTIAPQQKQVRTNLASTGQLLVSGASGLTYTANSAGAETSWFANGSGVRITMPYSVTLGVNGHNPLLAIGVVTGDITYGNGLTRMANLTCSNGNVTVSAGNDVGTPTSASWSYATGVTNLPTNGILVFEAIGNSANLKVNGSLVGTLALPYDYKGTGIQIRTTYGNWFLGSVLVEVYS